MRPTSKRSRSPALVAKLSPIFHHLRPFNQVSKRLAVLALIATPLYAQAALPAAIQAALSRADLTEADISIIITPVGDKNASHLPAPIQVIDSQSDNSSESTSQPTLTTNATSNTNNSVQKTTPSDARDEKNHLVQPSTLITIEQRTIKKREQALHAYTDDPYTYQSLESIPTVLDDSSKTTVIDDHNNHESGNTDSNTGTPSIKMSFSPLLSHQPDVARTPASTMKLVPSFIALDTLGTGFVWHTRVYHTGLIIGDRLHGDLVIQGSGDPKMTHERLAQLLYKVQSAGIHHIDGDIIIDSAVFKNITKDPAAFDNSPLRPYNASPDGFLVNFSTIGIKSYPLDNGQASLIYTPQLANYQLPTTINTRSASCGQASYSLSPQWKAKQLMLNADLPSSCGEHVFYVAYPDAKDFAARIIAEKWQALGNTLSGDVITQEVPYAGTKSLKSTHGLTALSMSPLPIVSYPSLNLTQQIYDINHFSNNVMAEQVALSIGAYGNAKGVKTHDETHVKNHRNESSLYQFGKPTTTDYPAALQSINQWWQTNLSTPPPHLTNGSGLCRECTISAANLSELLTYAYDSPSFDAYVNSLGVAGVSGTITAHGERLPESAAIGRAWIKTGTLNNVTSMAGYVKGLSGQDYVVVGLINSEQSLNAYTARPVLDAMLDWTAEH
ncbi:D-alanyl-D-alanine carboxypeptidase/D-alanyl-D-alanine-endopeptidase [Psychrobacter fozii]|uniref:D-alanyl-D-alanine carboxypeptidase/D-alanyl-D-alanine-endopeptidase (Penicillin-binding protein 4) n=1 Tax=Psychrobacter fozii TaxID=198480 RepID=A0A2V4VH08_9GAMM|nr:D-alanyl-D-alanine carboxypeptidase [Psychrobacter fozii]PYE38065.1 D-alanyl-D-alanine carboxypeptidase/D-alanyl-D-alanine-endopeptidase (penicillin-binding protein 4) [Psychrobacter fozii]